MTRIDHGMYNKQICDDLWTTKNLLIISTGPFFTYCATMFHWILQFHTTVP